MFAALMGMTQKRGKAADAGERWETNCRHVKEDQDGTCCTRRALALAKTTDSSFRMTPKMLDYIDTNAMMVGICGSSF